MSDLDDLVKQQIQQQLHAQFENAVQMGDVGTATQLSEQLHKLRNPLAGSYGINEVKDILEKEVPWFGKDVKKTKLLNEYAQLLSPKGIPTAKAYADMLVAEVEKEFKSPPPSPDEDEEEEEEEEEEKPAPKKVRKQTDAPATDTPVRRKGSSGNWEKLSDLPRELRDQHDAAAKRMGSTYTKEQREEFTKRFIETASKHRKDKK